MFLERLNPYDVLDLIKQCAIAGDDVELLEYRFSKESVTITVNSHWESNDGNPPVLIDDTFELSDFVEPVGDIRADSQKWHQAMYKKFGDEYAIEYFKRRFLVD